MDKYLFLIFFFVMALIGILSTIFSLPKSVYTGSLTLLKEKAEEIRRNGTLLATKDGGGRIGSLNFSRLTLTVEIYIEGLVFISPILSNGCLLKEDIIEITEKKGFISKVWTVIRHKSHLIRGNQVVIYGSLDESVKVMLLS